MTRTTRPDDFAKNVFEVHTVWKGPLVTRLIVFAEFPYPGESLTKQGETYLVYAYESEEAGGLAADMCGVYNVADLKKWGYKDLDRAIGGKGKTPPTPIEMVFLYGILALALSGMLWLAWSTRRH